ncbi:unnamed protein product, partial [Darwinula stevensoni]
KREGKLEGQPEALWVQGYQQIPVIDPVAVEVVAVGDLPQVYLLAVENLTQIHVFAFQGASGFQPFLTVPVPGVLGLKVLRLDGERIFVFAVQESQTTVYAVRLVGGEAAPHVDCIGSLHPDHREKAPPATRNAPRTTRKPPHDTLRRRTTVPAFDAPTTTEKTTEKTREDDGNEDFLTASAPTGSPTTANASTPSLVPPEPDGGIEAPPGEEEILRDSTSSTAVTRTTSPRLEDSAGETTVSSPVHSRETRESKPITTPPPSDPRPHRETPTENETASTGASSSEASSTEGPSTDSSSSEASSTLTNSTEASFTEATTTESRPPRSPRPHSVTVLTSLPGKNLTSTPPATILPSTWNWQDVV